MIATLRRLTVLDRIATGYAAVYFGCLLARAAGATVPAVLEVAFFPLGLVVGWANWRNARIRWLDGRTRLAWRLLAGAAIILWLSGTTWTIWVAWFGRDAVAAWIDRGAFLQYALAIVAYLCFPGGELPRGRRWRFVLDAALIVVAGFVIAFYIGLRLLLHGPSETVTVLILESTLDWALFVMAAVGWMEKRDRVIRRALVLLLCANLVTLAGNYVLAILPDYSSGHPVDGFWFAAWVLRWAAARLAWHHYRAIEDGAAPPAPVVGYRGNPFAYVLVGAAFVLLIVQIWAGDERNLVSMLAVAATAMGALLVLRHFAELEESRRLFRMQVERESRFTSLVANSSDLVLVIDGAGIVTYVSPSLSRVFGPDVRLEPGTSLHRMLTPDDAKTLSTLLSGGARGASRFESRVEVSPGNWREVEAVWTDLRRDPAVAGIVVNCRDVTERNEIERHLRHAQKLDAMGHMAGGLAHDLNNVLAVIRGYSELLRSDMDESSPAIGDIDQILKAVNRAASVTQKVLAFSRKQPGRRTLLDLNGVVRDLDPMLGHLMKDHVRVRLSLAPDLWPVLADQGQVEQVLVNLLTNARDAMPDGGLVEIATANRALAGRPGDPPGLPPGDYASLAVRDEGSGMSPAILSHVFEPFFTTKPKERGIGLGLAIVHGIITELNGRIDVESIEGRGSTLTLLLPRAHAAASTPR